MLFTDYRTSNESMLAKYSHLLPIQLSRASNLLPLLLGRTCSQTRWVTPTISTAVIDFLPINQARLNSYRFCPFQGILRTLWKVVMPFIRSFGFNSTTVYRKIKHDFFKPTPQSPYIRLAVSPEMDRTSVLPGLWAKNQILWSIIRGVTQRVCKQVPPSNKGRRLNALDGWIGNRWECLASIVSLLVVL